MVGTMLRSLLAVAWFTVITLPAYAESNVTHFLANREPSPNAANTPPRRWSATENVRWRTDIPGLAWSSPIVWDGRVFLTTCVSSAEEREPKKGLYIEALNANNYPKDDTTREWKVICLDLSSGNMLWERTVHQGIAAKPHHIKNTLASETPTTDGERIYAMFGNLGLYCLDLDGNLEWKFDLPPRETRMAWGTSQSPIVDDSRVYLCNDNEESSELIALDKHTGAVIWRKAREETTNYSTPFLWKHDLRTELVVSGIGHTVSYDTEGNELWRLKGKSILAIPTPFAKNGKLYLTSGHVVWGESPIYCVRPGATGDISPSDSGEDNAWVEWYLEEGGPYHPTPLVLDDVMYVLHDRGFMAAYNANTGRTIYDARKKRIPKGRAFTSSHWTYQNTLFCLNEDGVTFAIQPGSEFEVLHTNTLEEDDMCMASPCIVDDMLLIRTSKRLYCIQKSSRLGALDWMIGDWVQDTERASTRETWTKISDTVVTGIGLTTSKSTGKRNRESMLLVEMAGEVFYLAKVAQNEFPIPFALIESSATHAVFQNLNHDFPKRLDYRLQPDKSLRVRVSDGGENGFTLEFHPASGGSIVDNG